jgi:hypothetical protein
MFEYSDRNSLMRMIEAAVLNDERVATLRIMADRAERIEDALALYLLIAVEGTKNPRSNPQWSRLTRESERFLLDLCGKVSLSELQLRPVERAAVLDSAALVALDSEELQRRARIGSWPLQGRLLFGQYTSFLAKRSFFPRLSLEEVHVLGVYVWSRYALEIVRAGKGFDETALFGITPNARDFFGGEQRLGDSTTGNADIAIQALCEAIKVGAVRITGSKREFIEAVGRWGTGVLRNGDVRAWVADELLDVAELSEAELQSDATYWPKAAHELGIRGVPLLIPDRQMQETFKDGVREAVGPWIVSGDVDVDRERFFASQDPLERYILSWCNSQKGAQAKYDPFGHSVHVFATEERLVLKTPSYQDYVNYIAQHKQFFAV